MGFSTSFIKWASPRFAFAGAGAQSNNFALIQDYSFRKEWPVITTLFIFGLIFRFPSLNDYSLWLDEAWRVAKASTPLSTFAEHWFLWANQIISYDGLLRLIISLFGYSEFAVRMPSALAGALVVPATYRLGRFLFEKELAALAALLVCLSPLLISYSQEAAAYSIASLATLTFLISATLFVSEMRIGRFVAMAISALVMVLAYPYLLLLVVVTLGFYAYTRGDRRFLLAVLACMGVVLLLSIPSLGSLFVSNGDGQLRVWEVNDWIRSYPIRILNAFISGPLNEQHCRICLGDIYTPTPFNSISKIFAWVALLAVVFLAPISIVKLTKESRNLTVWVISFGIYIIFLVLQSLITNHAEVRYIVPILPIVLIAFVSIAKGFVRKWVNVLGFSALIILLFNFFLIIKEDPPGERWKPDARSLARHIKNVCEENRGVVLINPELFELPIYEFYLNRSNCKVVRSPAYEEFFYRNQRKILYRTPEQLQNENDWFKRYFQKNQQFISKVFIVTQRSKDRAKQILVVAAPQFSRVTQTETNHIMVIKLEN